MFIGSLPIYRCKLTLLRTFLPDEIVLRRSSHQLDQIVSGAERGRLCARPRRVSSPAPSPAALRQHPRRQHPRRQHPRRQRDARGGSGLRPTLTVFTTGSCEEKRPAATVASV
eukprot:6186159-Pleurochrysis_carterae.AAC.3